MLVACSGGADSLALALAANFVVPRIGDGVVGAVVVDHHLQPSSSAAAAQAVQECSRLGMTPAEVVDVEVPPGNEGPEQAARAARYEALATAAARQGAAVVLLGHTRNDQAEQVLLGLARGSGARSLSGMPAARPLRSQDRDEGTGSKVLLLRPFLGIDRATTVRACEAAGLTPWHDPHNGDPAFARVRARALVTHLEAELGPGLVSALARSADLLRTDADALDTLSESAYTTLGPLPWPVRALAAHPEAIRTRLYLRAVRAGGATAGSLAAVHLRAVDDLAVNWHGQGPVDVPGPMRFQRRDGLIWLEAHKPS